MNMLNVWGTVRVTYRYECDKCFATEVERLLVKHNEEFPHPVKPQGWRMVEDRIYCPKHIITIDDLKDTPPPLVLYPRGPTQTLEAD
jgi:hypothetical protein